jgi:lipopolysaccharide/colanic/teichoic acid biosynthesis glycosyltransferase
MIEQNAGLTEYFCFLKQEEDEEKSMNISVKKVDRSKIISSKRVYIDKIYVKSNPKYETAKRIFDVVVSALSILILSPVMLIAALIVFLQDFHNPFFVQTRLTKNGREFKMLKLRSMCVDAENKQEQLEALNEADGPVFKIEDDPRITPFGKFIRKTSIDELPQLVNVLTGDMSIVGPRPPLPKEAECYTSYQKHRLDVKSGLTCYWQCSGRSNISFDEWMDLDIQYIKERSAKTDVKIIFKTFKAVLKMEGAK